MSFHQRGCCSDYKCRGAIADEDRSASPTKDRGQGQGQGQQGGGGMIRRNGNGPRQALGELSLEEEEEGQKRHRAV